MLRTVVVSLFLCSFTYMSFAISIKTELDPSIFEERNCEELYQKITELEVHTLNFESPLYNTRNNTIGSVASTMFTPAVFFVGFSNAMTFKSEYEASKYSQEINYLRRKMGEKQCFTK